MAKKKKSENPWTGAAEALQDAPTKADASPGDKSALGQLQCALEAAQAAAPETDAALGTLLGGLVELSGLLMLDEVKDAEAAEELLFRATEDLRAALAEDGKAISQAVETLQQQLTAILSPGGTDADTQEAENALPAIDALQLHGEEDSIIYAEFVTESTEHLENIEARALELETSGGDVDLINDMFRCFHSMKGAAGFLGLTSINTLCHEVETMLDRARKLTLRIDRTVVDVILASIDASKRLLGIVQFQLEHKGDPEAVKQLSPIDTRPLLAAVQQILSRKPTIPSALEEPTGADAGKIGGILVADGTLSEAQLQEALAQQKKPVGEILVEMGAVSSDQVEGALARQTATKGPTTSAIKVDTQRLDSLMEMVGELVIAESQVQQDPALLREENLMLARNVAELDKIVRNLQELVMAMRLVPLKQTFQKMFRLVRDTARKTEKNVRLELFGEDTEIDKTVVEEINDPLVHLLRNAVDHGVESPEERAKAGKPEEGLVRLSAYHEGGNVVIEIRDDGKGLHPDRLLAKALEKGVAQDGVNYTDEEIFSFIFMPGFSTHAVATDISGRGVGMDVVKRNIERLGGRVEIQSEPGQGTTFLVRLPLTMAIVDGMIVRVGDEQYVLPTLGIRESIHPSPDQISTVGQRGEMIMVRGELLPLVRLHELFKKNRNGHGDSDSLVIIIDDEDRRCGIMVSELLGQQQVVIKNLGSRLKGIRGISGGCILGDGRVGLILDVVGLIKLAETN